MKTSVCVLLVFVSAIAASAAVPTIVSANNSRLDSAARAAGFNLQTATPQQKADMQTAFQWLRPGDRFEAYPLNDQQARAIIFLAFSSHGSAQPRGYVPSNRWEMAYDLQRSIQRGGRGLGLFLNDEEKADSLKRAQVLHDHARKIGKNTLRSMVQNLTRKLQSSGLVSRRDAYRLAEGITQEVREEAKPAANIAPDLATAAMAVVNSAPLNGRGNYLNDGERYDLNQLCVQLRIIALQYQRTDIADQALYIETEMEEEASFAKRRDLKNAADRIGVIVKPQLGRTVVPK